MSNMTYEMKDDWSIETEPFPGIFNKTEIFFHKNPDSYEKLLVFLGLQNDSYFFCRIFPEWKKCCFAYYI